MMIRLARKPSLRMHLLGRLMFAIVWVGLFFFASIWTWRHRYGTPAYALVMLAVGDLIAIGVTWDIVVRCRLMLTQGQPVVEVDRESVAYGDSLQVRIVEEHPEAFAEVCVTVIGECLSKSEREFTQHRETRIVRTQCYEEELLRVKPSRDPMTVRVHLPKSPPAEDVAWKIVIDEYLKKGGSIEHAFPFRVHQSA